MTSPSALAAILLALVGLHPPLYGQDGDAGKGSVLLYGEGAGAVDASYLASLILTPPDAAYDISYVIQRSVPRPEAFTNAAAVVVASLNEKAGTPWSPEEVSRAESWVASGGVLVLLGNAPVVLAGRSQQLGDLGRLLGVSQLQSAVGEQRIAGDSEITSGLQTTPWMRPGGWAAAGLTTATPLLTDGRTSLATMNVIGDGKVFFFGRDASRLSLSSGIESYAAMVGRAMLSGRVAKTPSSRTPWVLKALGPEAVPAAESKKHAPPTGTRLVKTPASGPSIKIATNGSPEATIVVASKPSRAAAMAAEALRAHVRKLTQAVLPIVPESELTIRHSPDGGSTQMETRAGERIAYAIVVGDSEIGKSLGITSETLPLEGTRIVTRGNLLFLVGSDQRPDGWPLEGTRFAVSSFLERHCGVRWLWPGELGTVAPLTPTLEIGAVDETDSPALRIRKLRDIAGSKRFEIDPISGAVTAKNSGTRAATAMSLLDRPLEEQVRRHMESGSWFDEMRLGQSYLAGASHAYSGWWDRYGSGHPEWFSLQPTGFRTQTPPREQFCQSSPGLVEAIASATVRKFEEDPRRDVVSIALNDVGTNSYCFCEACRRKDPINGTPTAVRYLIGGVSFLGLYPSLSDRVVGFFNEIADATAKIRPGAKVGVTAYNAYRASPLQARLRENTLLVFVGTNYFDRHVLDSDRLNWDRWSAHAPELILRPNTLHQGHAMPAVFVKGLSHDLKHGLETGMIGADYDSIVHHWATQGLNYYVLAKLLWDPSLDVDAIVADYCEKGFGPAAGSVREYFNALEGHTDEVAAEMGELTKNRLEGTDDDEPEAVAGAEFFIQHIPQLYSRETLSEWSSILARARSEAGADETILARIKFLEEGVAYARWQVEFFGLLANEREQRGGLQELAMKRRSDFQRMFDENYFAIQFGQALWREEFFWKQAGLTIPLGTRASRPLPP